MGMRQLPILSPLLLLLISIPSARCYPQTFEDCQDVTYENLLSVKPADQNLRFGPKGLYVMAPDWCVVYNLVVDADAVKQEHPKLDAAFQDTNNNIGSENGNDGLLAREGRNRLGRRGSDNCGDGMLTVGKQRRQQTRRTAELSPFNPSKCGNYCFMECVTGCTCKFIRSYCDLEPGHNWCSDYYECVK